MSLSKLGERAAEWTSRLVSLRSLTPDDGGCLELIGQNLKALGFATERLDRNGVANLWAHRGQGTPLLLWLGHVDTVPAGPEEQWEYPPFSGMRAHGAVHGRGAEDMKGGLAAFLAALEELEPDIPPAEAEGGLSLLLTSDEEGEALWGVRHAAAVLAERGSLARLCLVGEPTGKRQSGDRIRVGRRGSLSGLLTVRGQKEHVAAGGGPPTPSMELPLRWPPWPLKTGGMRPRKLFLRQAFNAPASNPIPGRPMSAPTSSEPASTCAFLRRSPSIP